MASTNLRHASGVKPQGNLGTGAQLGERLFPGVKNPTGHLIDALAKKAAHRGR